MSTEGSSDHDEFSFEREQVPEVKYDPKSFLEEKPLYLKEDLPDRDHPTDYNVAELHPEMIELHCPECAAERPFRSGAAPNGQGERIMLHHGQSIGGDISYSPYPFLTLEYMCTGCESHRQRFWLQFDFKDEWVRKIGQCPPWSIDISDDLRTTLGEDAALYKNAKILMSQSYGVGACAYLRLLVESQIETILGLVRDVILERDASEDDLVEVEEAMESHHFEDKLDVAGEYAPESLHVDGHNPIAILHKQYSECLHPPSNDDESMEVALRLAGSVEYVLRELSRQLSSSREFKETIKEIDHQ
jgi:hypothetical protein